jgi:hypothetical protein
LIIKKQTTEEWADEISKRIVREFLLEKIAENNESSHIYKKILDKQEKNERN